MSQTMTRKQKRDVYLEELKEGVWEGKPSIVINPFKDKEVSLKIIIGGAILLVGFILWNMAGTFFSERVVPSAQAFHNDLYKPEMTLMAEQGKTPAILWMAANYPDAKTNAQLDALIANNNADAMMVKAKQLYKARQPVAAEAMVNMAAAQGHPDAIQQTVKKAELSDDAAFSTIKTIVTDYVLK